MPTIAIVGAGTGVGAAVARRFGREGYAVALVSRTRANLDALTEELRADGVDARGYAADVRDASALRDALGAAAADLGPIQVLQYSPVPHRDFLKPVLETTEDDLRAATEFSIIGVHAAVDAVLPAMREAGEGTLVLLNGGTAVRPLPDYAGTSVAFAGASAYARMLHAALAPEGVHVVQLVIPGAIRDDDPVTNPGAIADVVWGLHHRPGGAGGPGTFRHLLTPMDES